MAPLYLNIENIIFKARSQIRGFAGMPEKKFNFLKGLDIFKTVKKLQWVMFLDYRFRTSILIQLYL